MKMSRGIDRTMMKIIGKLKLGALSEEEEC